MFPLHGEAEAQVVQRVTAEEVWQMIDFSSLGRSLMKRKGGIFRRHIMAWKREYFVGHIIRCILMGVLNTSYEIMTENTA